MKYHVAQVNIGKIRAPLEDAQMAGFVNRLEDINALADGSPGFVWRLQTPAGNATYLRPYDDDRILVNMSVWESIEAIKNYVYRTAHAELLRHRQEWFEAFVGSYMALWWVPVGHIPGVDEAKKRLAYLEKHGPSQFAFTFKSVFAPDEEFQRRIDWSSFQPCPAV
jgi:heme-degrading monooxygenase HmoA